MKLRRTRFQDLAALLRLQAEQNQRDGRNFGLPDLFGKNVVMALTIEDERESVRGAVYFEAPGHKAVEMCLVGCDPKSTIEIREGVAPITYALRSLGLDSIYTLIPESSPKRIVKELERVGFKDQKLRYFSLDLRGEQ